MTAPERPLLGPDDLYLFNEGTHGRLWESLGCHLDREGATFAVWAPDAEAVWVTGDFNGWADPGEPLSGSSAGIWSGRVSGVAAGQVYKYRIRSRPTGETFLRGDPFAFATEVPPKTGSVVWEPDYAWGDREWMAGRASQTLDEPVSIYEVHLGSWARDPDEPRRFLTYREIAVRLADYVEELGFTHVELLPVMEHPFYGSWGYQVTGYFAPSARFGSPEDLMFLIDHLHQRGIGVILDWVPSHFPTDPHGLARYDGTHLYEHADAREGFHPDWHTAVFNYGRNEVRSFLLSSALFWLDLYHADALRVDAVASMLYRDYSRSPGDWVPNVFGGRENLEAVSFLRLLNERVYGEYPGAQTIAEESTAWPGVSRPVYAGGLGFGMKWDMGWMHDTLQYMALDPVHRKFHHDMLTFRMIYAFTENFVLALSHDEVVHGKGSLVAKMPGDDWQKFANLRLLYGYMFGMPGKKLLFMGDEFGQWDEWDHEQSLHWHQVAHAPHRGIQQWVRDLNRIYRDRPALHRRDFEPAGFEWVAADDREGSVISFLRTDGSDRGWMLVVCNFTPVPRHGYRVGVPVDGTWREVLNSDATAYWGGGSGNYGAVTAEDTPGHGRPFTVSLTLPPLGVVFLEPA